MSLALSLSILMTHEPHPMTLSLPIVMGLALRVSDSYEPLGYDVTVVTQLIWRKSFLLSTCWPSTNQEMLDIKEYFILFWIMFLLILVQDADGDMPQSLYPKLVTVPEVGMCC